MTESIETHDPSDGTELRPIGSGGGFLDMLHTCAISASADASIEAQRLLLEGVPAAEAVLIHLERVDDHS